jgi:tripartite-type tricarboxylate transporter receptor subunit TctC
MEQRKGIGAGGQCRASVALRLVTLLAAAFASSASFAYPTQRIQIVVPFSPGSVLDTLARVTARQFSGFFDHQVVVVNRLGAGGVTAFAEVDAAGDHGHTILFSGQTPLTVQPNLKSDLPYRPEHFVPICQMFETPFALVVGPESQFRTFNEVLARARAQPGAVRYGHSGIASFPHLLGALLEHRAEFRMAGIPYRSNADALKDVAGGAIEAAIFSIGSFSASSVRVLAVFNSKRSAAFPDVPTVAELGYPVALRSVNGIFAKADSPPTALTRLQEACARAFQSDEFSRMAARLDVNATFVGSEAFVAQLEGERRDMKPLIDSLGLK